MDHPRNLAKCVTVHKALASFDMSLYPPHSVLVLGLG